MIDFRYHIVSLIAVFMALAVGIVIGAGPLRDYLAEELSGQVDQLRTEKEELRVALDEAQADGAETAEFVAAASPVLLSGSLEGRTVAVVQLEQADNDDVEAVLTRLEQAGAQVVVRTELTDGWTDPGQRAFREGIAGNIAAYLNPQPDDDARSEQVLGMALGQALTLRDPENLSVASDEADAMYDLLISSELIGEIEAPSEPAYATVVIDGTEETQDLETETQINAVLTSTFTGLVRTGEGHVLAGTARAEGDLLLAVREQESLASSLSTVDGVDLITGQVTVPLALAADIAGTAGAYGTSDSADEGFPATVGLLPPDPQEFAPGSPDAPADEESGTDEGAENGEDTQTDDEAQTDDDTAGAGTEQSDTDGGSADDAAGTGVQDATVAGWRGGAAAGVSHG